MNISVAPAANLPGPGTRPAAGPFRVGDCRVDPDLNQITGPAGSMQLEPKAIAVLAYLADRPGKVIGAEELIQAVWRGRPMGDNPVYRCISQLRRALGDDPRRPRYLATVPTKGYRLVATVEPLAAAAPGVESETVVPVSRPRRGLRPAAMAVGILLALALAGYGLQRAIAPPIAMQQNGPAGAVPATIPPPDASSPPDSHFAAYQHYLIGQEILSRRPEHYMPAAGEHFGRALAIDPGYAEAYAGRAIAGLLADGFQPDQAVAVLDASQHDIETALALDQHAPLAHSARGLLLQMKVPPDLAGSEESLRRALELDPRQANAWNWLSRALIAQGRDDESYEALRQAARVDPLAPSSGANLAAREAERGQFAAAEARLRRLLDVPQPARLVSVSLVDLYLELGRLSDAVEVSRERILRSVNGAVAADSLHRLAWAYAMLGAWDRVDYWRNRAEREPGIEYGADLDWAHFELHFGRPGHVQSARRFEQVLRQADLAPDSLPTDLRIDYASLLALAGEFGRARDLLEPWHDAALRKPEPAVGADAQHALAWTWLHTGDAARAQRLLSGLQDHYRNLHQDGRLHLGSQLVRYARNQAMLGEIAHALDLLERAEAAGWRDYFHVANDPRWDALRGEHRFRAVLQRVKADIDAQRNRFDAAAAEREFIERLDALIRSRETLPRLAGEQGS